jgi:hypothetical protein
VPVNVSVVGEFDALLRNETPPEAAPDTCGAKVTAKETLCPAISVTGKVMPLKENPAPVQLAEDIVTAEVPSVTFLV